MNSCLIWFFFNLLIVFYSALLGSDYSENGGYNTQFGIFSLIFIFANVLWFAVFVVGNYLDSKRLFKNADPMSIYEFAVFRANYLKNGESK